MALSGNNVSVDTSVVLPSGKLTLSAERDVLLGDKAKLDLAGRKIDFYDTSKYSWGGDVILDSRAGDVRQAAASVIDVSAVNNRAGKLSVVATGDAAGTADLRGTLLGGASGSYDAGGTQVAYAAGGADIRAQRIGDFAGLNQRLNTGKVFGSRSFQLKQGDLAIGDEVKAPVVEALEKLKEALKGTDNDSEVKAAMEDLNTKAAAMGQAVYAASQAQAQEQASPADAGGSDVYFATGRVRSGKFC